MRLRIIMNLVLVLGSLSANSFCSGQDSLSSSYLIKNSSSGSRKAIYVDFGGINYYYSLGFSICSNKLWQHNFGFAYFDNKLESRVGGTTTLFSYELYYRFSTEKKNSIITGVGANIGIDFMEMFVPGSQICPNYNEDRCPLINYYSIDFILGYRFYFCKHFDLLPGCLIRSNINFIKNLSLWPIIRVSYYLQ